MFSSLWSERWAVMLWLVVGTAFLAVMLLGLRALERAPAAAVRAAMLWVAIFAGAVVIAGLFLTGRGFPALAGLTVVGPALWNRWKAAGIANGTTTGTANGAANGAANGTASGTSGRDAGGPPPRTRGGMARAEAYQVLGLAPGAAEADIVAAHRRLMRTAHPDAGGTDWLASRINQARDALLG